MLTLYIYERAQERAKTDATLQQELRTLDRLNEDEQHARACHATAQQRYAAQEQVIADYMNRNYPENNPVHDHQED